MSEHEDIARRLRDQAQASAPADLLPAVMAEVRAEPHRAQQRRRWPARPRWQPVAAWTAAAATLVALGFGIAHLPSTTSSSSASSESHAAGGLNPPTRAAAVAPGAVEGQPQVFTVPQAAALSILGRYLPTARLPASGKTLRVDVPSARFSEFAFKLRQAQLKGSSTTYQGPASPVIIKLFRAHKR